MSTDHLNWWNDLRHGGLLLDAQRLSKLITTPPDPLDIYEQGRFRLRLQRFREDARAHRGELVAHVLQYCCGFSGLSGTWSRGGEVPASWSRRAVTGESVRPRHLWLGENGAILPVFIDDQPRLGVGRGHRIISQTLQWLRQGQEQLALVTNGQQWRLVFAGLDYDAFCEWDIDLWLTEGEPSSQFQGFRSLLDPALWTPPGTGERCPLLVAINDSRRGQSDLSQILGERVRQAVELLVQGHAPALAGIRDSVSASEIYRAAVRVVMRMVVVLFAESREGLLPRDNPVFYASYSLQGLRERLEQVSPYQLRSNYSAWFRVLAMFRMVFEGSSHEALPVPAYGGELFAPGDPHNADGMLRALHVFETGAFHHDLMTDAQVREILVKLTRTRVRLRQGRSNVMTTVPVDFSSLDSEYIGILYEGLLDFELKTAPPDQPVIFLAVGNQPALPLATLEAMDDASIRNLLEKMKDTSSGDDEEGDEEAAEEEAEDENTGEEDADQEPLADEEPVDDASAAVIAPDDVQHTTRARAEAWARRAVEVGRLVRRPAGRLSPERQMAYEAEIERKARQIIPRVVQPGEWYLARWGGTRKGSGTFYTRPQLAVPTVHRTLRPLAYDPPAGSDGQPNIDAPLEAWTPKPPEHILELKVCDPACGSGTFPLAALRFLTQALYASLEHHGRIRESQGRSILSLIRNTSGTQALAEEALPCRPDDNSFEPRTRAILRRYVVERCIYGVDFDPLAVELCRLSLWIETLDRRLPFTFLDHKIKTGNSLVGAWFDQFLHYPIMAWAREGGDKSHSNGVHYEQGSWTSAIKRFETGAKQDLIRFISGGNFPNMFPMDLTQVKTVHDKAEAALRAIHELGIEKAAERAAIYAELRSSEEFTNLQDAFDLWCSLWFWPADRLEHAPLPTVFGSGQLSDETLAIARDVARQRRFFHWELEFPDVFSTTSHGFHAILGNPPWETLQPNSKEFFSSIDPLYRSYGNQEAQAKQVEFFTRDREIERRWLEYTTFFKEFGNWYKCVDMPFGNRISTDNNGRQSHDLNLGDRGRNSFVTSQSRHERWRLKREQSSGYADADHAFRYQGTGKAYTYKMFVELSHALLQENGRLGLIVPSGLYSDHGTIALRNLFIDQCRWEWLFGFENREKVFDIDSRFKFNPVIVTKGGQTESIRTAFMRRSLADWERAEQLSTPYAREQIDQFSPHSRAILEIQSRRDLEILTKIYANSVLLGDQTERGWGIKYAQGDFNMTSDSALFPPRPKWKEWGYRPDEYSRWIKGPWKPIDELWAVLGVDPARPVPIDEACRNEIEAGIARGDVGRTEWRVRCAQPPYDTLPIPRADIPPGVILSREADAWLREDEIPVVTFTEANGRPLRIKTGRSRNAEAVEVRGPAIALPLYEGRMIGQFDFSEKGWVSGKGRGAVWREINWARKPIEPQYLLGKYVYSSFPIEDKEFKVGIMDVTSSTNTRTVIATALGEVPTSHKVPTIKPKSPDRTYAVLGLVAILDSFVFDFLVRIRFSGLSLVWAMLAENAVPRMAAVPMSLGRSTLRLSLQHAIAIPEFLSGIPSDRSSNLKTMTAALTTQERTRTIAAINAIVAAVYGISSGHFNTVIAESDYPKMKKAGAKNLNAKGFWRVDKDKHPEHRLTVLSLIAFHDLQQKISECGGDLQRGIEAFCNQNDGEGWMLPEKLRLADYGLGHDDRAQEPQPVRACFGPRFYDWQLAQSAEESWRECHLHARNLLGEAGYQALRDELAGNPSQASLPSPNPPPGRQTRDEDTATSHHGREHQPGLFSFDDELPFPE